MSRFFIPSENIYYEETRPVSAAVYGDDVNHIRNVLRMSVGEPLLLCDSRGLLYHCVIAEMTAERILAKVESVTASETERQIPVYLFQGVPKGDKMELIIQKGVELGVNGIFPVLTERTVVKFHSASDMEKKQTRWQRISLEAAKQCGRDAVPEVAMPIPIEKVSAYVTQPMFQNALKLIPYENEQNITLKNILQKYRTAFSEAAGESAGEAQNVRFDSICVMIGPEGGFSVGEVKTMTEAGFFPVSLGKRILRTETAGFAAVAAIRYEFED